MKKMLCVIGGFLIGAASVVAAQDVSAQIKSMIGQKVTGEYTVFVNGKELQERGAIIDGKANVPIRALSDSLGVELKVNNETKSIMVTSGNENVILSGDNSTGIEDLSSKEDLLIKKSELEADLDFLQKSKERDQAKYDDMQARGKIEGGDVFINAIEILDKKITQKTKELADVNEALKFTE